MIKVSEFTGPYAYLSNFYAVPFTWFGYSWPTAEHAYQAAKSLSQVDWDYIRALPSPGKAKRAGRGLSLRADWEQVKVPFMYSILHAKFSQNPGLRKALQNTAPAVLEEGNHWGDRVWGISPPDSGQGENLLGKTLMKLRDTFDAH